MLDFKTLLAPIYDHLKNILYKVLITHEEYFPNEIRRWDKMIFLPSNAISIVLRVNSMPFFVKHCRN